MTLMRGGTAGLQRYSVFPWSTDVSRSWGGLQPQVKIMLNSGLSGLGYMSHDVGGFAIDETAPIDPEPSVSPSRTAIPNKPIFCLISSRPVTVGCLTTTLWLMKTRPKATRLCVR